ncbi:MAG TPA: YfiR family protein [Elusimicrobiales bacterium]|nr:YfiR family protein [Elusimicrobiales bacterium]
MSNGSWLKAGACGIFLTLLAAPLPCRAAAGTGESAALEDKVKTAFLYKFTKYVQWPEAGQDEDFQIAVIGDSGLIAPLRELAREKLSNGGKIKVERWRSPEDIGPCRILFIAASERERLGEILKKTEGKNILTVGDSKGLAALGVAINFVVVDGKVRFEINRRAAAQAGVEISSQLLKLAILVEDKKGERDGQP